MSPVHELPEEKWDDIVAVCLTAAFHTTKAALPGMMEAKWGRIINTGSMHSVVASPYKSAYNAAKHGIAGEFDLPKNVLRHSQFWIQSHRASFFFGGCYFNKHVEKGCYHVCS